MIASPVVRPNTHSNKLHRQGLLLQEINVFGGEYLDLFSLLCLAVSDVWAVTELSYNLSKGQTPV